MKIKRISPGYYNVSANGRTVIIVRNNMLAAQYGQWIAYANWDRYLVTDPLMTYKEAKEEAAAMLKGDCDD